MRVEAATAVSDELVDAFARLLPQLSSSATAPSREELDAIVSSPATTILLAWDDSGVIVGSLTLAVFRIPAGIRAWIDDVVVDEAARGQGVGEALIKEALGRSRAAGARKVDLTSRPAREAANRLYEKIGFRARESNVYRYELS